MNKVQLVRYFMHFSSFAFMSWQNFFNALETMEDTLFKGVGSGGGQGGPWPPQGSYRGGLAPPQIGASILLAH